MNNHRKGRTYENEVVNGLYNETADHVKVYPCGYSGSNAIPQPDVVVTTLQDNHALELKRGSGETCYVPEDDCDQLAACVGPQTRAWLVVRFNNRRPICIPYYERSGRGIENFGDKTPAERLSIVTPTGVDSHVTDGGSLAVECPSLDDWPSASESADDPIEIASDLGIENENSIAVDDL